MDATKHTGIDAAAQTLIVSEWIVDTPERQISTIEAIATTWEFVPWPAGLISTTLLTSTDGEVLLNYARWNSDEAYNTFVKTHRQSLAERLDRAVPGIQRRPAVNYRLYRSSAGDNAAVPGCIVIVSVEFDGPNEARQRQWVDSVFEALAGESALPPGGISGRFHVSTDGTRVLNYAEWTNEEAHEDALNKSGQRSIGRGSKWLELQKFPGLKANSFRRYHPKLSLIPLKKQTVSA